MANDFNALSSPVFPLKSDVSKNWGTWEKVGSFATFGPLMSPYSANWEISQLSVDTRAAANSAMNVKCLALELHLIVCKLLLKLNYL